MQHWPFEVHSTTKEEILEYCVNDDLWQQYRLRMKGIVTEAKLDKLFLWREQGLLHAKSPEESRRYQVQIDNYINALKRGGLLDDNLRVQR